MTDGLKDKHRAAIVAAIAANDRVERAVLFGSRATGTNTATSDVDIALFGDLLTLTDQAYLAAALDEIPMAQSVDLLLYDSIQSRKLREHIRRQGIEWYARPPREEGDVTASDSGAEWPVVKLEEVSSDEPGAIAIGPFGSRMKSDVYTLSGVPVIRGTNISTSRAWRNEWVYVSDDFADGLPNCNVREGDLVFPHRGSIGEVAIIPGDRDRYMLSTSLMKFRPDPDKVSPLFLFYYFKSDTGRSVIMRYASQVGTPGIGQPLTSLRQFQVPLPPREEQERIAGILSPLDGKIELNRQMNQTLEEMARALFKSWFVDFDPVHARAALKHHDTIPPQGGSVWSVERARAYLDRMDPNIAALFPDRFADAELGPIPEGWEVSTIGEEVAVVGGSTPSTKDRSLWGGAINWVTPKDLSTLSAPVLLETARQISDTGLSKISSGLLPRGSVLLSSRAPIGYLAIAEIPVAVNQGFIAMRCKSRLSNVFVWLWTQANIDTILRNANGSTFQEISKRNFRPLRVAIPEPDILSAFDEHVRPSYEQIVKNQRESRTLAALRDTLQPKLITGKLRVKGAERIVEVD